MKNISKEKLNKVNGGAYNPSDIEVELLENILSSFTSRDNADSIIYGLCDKANSFKELRDKVYDYISHHYIGPELKP